MVVSIDNCQVNILGLFFATMSGQTPPWWGTGGVTPLLKLSILIRKVFLFCPFSENHKGAFAPPPPRCGAAPDCNILK